MSRLNVHNPSHLLIVPLLSGAIALSGATRAQEADQPVGAFVETVDVSVVNVDVYVTDRQGNPVTGLTRDDFELLVDGRPEAITNFFAVAGPAAAASSAASEPPAPTPAPGETPTAPVEAKAAPLTDETPESQRLWMVIYVDNSNLDPLNRNRVFRQLRAFLHDTVDATDEVMVVSYDRPLRVRQPFTSDPQAVTRTLLDLETHSGRGSAGAAEREDMLRAIDEAESSIEVGSQIRLHAESIRNDMQFTLDALSETVRSLAGLPGRKAVLYLSNGIPMTPGSDLFYAQQQKFDDGAALAREVEFNLSRRFEELTNLANANRVAFFTLDAAGLQVGAGLDAEYRGRSVSADWHGAVLAAHQANMDDPLRYMAQRTGGVAILNTNDVGPGLDKVAATFDSYYSLGFSRNMTVDGRYHKIKVRVIRKGLTVRHREGFREKNADTRMQEAVEAALRFGQEHNPLAVQLSLSAVRRDEDQQVLPLVVRIPLRELLLVPQGDRHIGRATVYFSALDADGNLAPIQSVRIPIEVPDADLAEALQKVWPVRQELLLGAGRQTVAVAVRDELANRVSVLTSTTAGG